MMTPGLLVVQAKSGFVSNKVGKRRTITAGQLLPDHEITMYNKTKVYQYMQKLVNLTKDGLLAVLILF